MEWRFVGEAGAWAISQTPLRLIVAVNFEYILYFDEQEESNICNITDGIFEWVLPIGWFHPSNINGPIKIEKQKQKLRSYRYKFIRVSCSYLYSSVLAYITKAY